MPADQATAPTPSNAGGDVPSTWPVTLRTMKSSASHALFACGAHGAHHALGKAVATLALAAKRLRP